VVACSAAGMRAQDRQSRADLSIDTVASKGYRFVGALARERPMLKLGSIPQSLCGLALALPGGVG